MSPNKKFDQVNEVLIGAMPAGASHDIGNAASGM